MNSLSSENKKIVIAGIAVALIALLWWVFIGQKNRRTAPAVTPEQTLEEVRQAAEAASAPEVKVPTSANPIKKVLPEETPLEKTNPFNKIYENPFE